ncbi:hypothetical protein OSB04_008243 [Centaurea solstitialis]|uniref:CBS domain-containing protein n=1 Tax=Centaurea solstitialis TaxID=347529 RepID=A0AA38TLE9_9ASTR|nr:hypothetical protein OSB04_008243 [Centaurea solstitialis]
MARSFLATQVSDLCVGKPPLRSLPATATVADAVSALKRSGDINVGIWSCNHSDHSTVVGNDVVSCRRRTFCALFKLSKPRFWISVPESKGQIRHLEPNSSLLEAIDYILEGLKNLVIPIHKPYKRKIHANSSFSGPTHHNARNSVVNHNNTLIGEISPFTLSCCDETFASAVATLSARDLMAYIDYNGPPEDLVHLVKKRLNDRNLTAMLDLMEDCNNPSCSSSSGSDEEFGYGKKGGMGRSYPGRRSEAIVCHPWNTLMAVMVQMIAHRVGYAWVVREDYGLVGIVSFREILKQLRSVVGE